MALSINTNIASLQAQMNLNKASEAMKQNQERLSTGLRINSASDDAAGLAITDRMTSQIRGLDQAAANANDGISLAKTAEGAMDETTNILQRMRELAVQSANDSNTETDRQSIQDEVNQLINEVDRIAENTTYNTKNVLDGNLENSAFQVGADEGQTIEFGIGSAKSGDLGYFGGVNSGNFTMATTNNNVTSDMESVTDGNSLQALDEGDLIIDGTQIRASQSGDDTASTTDNAASAIAIAEAINDSSETTNVTAKAEQTEARFTVSDSGAMDTGAIVINGQAVNGLSSAAANTGAQAISIAQAIRDSGIEGVADAQTVGDDIKITAEDGRNIEIATATSGDSGVSNYAHSYLEDFGQGETKTVRGQVSLYSSESFEISGDNPNVVGFSPGGVQLQTSSLKDVADTSSDTFAALQDGDLLINGQQINSIDDYNETSIASGNFEDYINSNESTSHVAPKASAKSTVVAINSTSELENVTAEAKTVANLGKVSAYEGDISFTINNTSISLSSVDIEDGDSTGSLVAALNSGFSAAENKSDGLVADVNDNGELTITSDEGVNIDVAVGNGDGSGTAASTDFLGNINTTDNNEHVAAKGTISFTEDSNVESIDGDAKALAGIEDEDRTISTLDVTTREGANNAISAIDEAIEQIDNEKAKLGAIQNRFDSTISNLNNVQQNITEARSRIQDADIAKESSEQTMNQVRRQAASSVLAQANQGPQLAMQLLGG